MGKGTVRRQEDIWHTPPLSAPREAPAKPDCSADCHAVFEGQIQEMTQGPSALPDNFTPLFAPGLHRLAGRAGSCFEVSQLVPSKRQLCGAAVTDAMCILTIMLSHSSNELWNIAGIISAMLAQRRHAAVGLPGGSQQVCSADEAISLERELVPSHDLKSPKPKREDVRGWTGWFALTVRHGCAHCGELPSPWVTHGFSNSLKSAANCEGIGMRIHSYINFF